MSPIIKDKIKLELEYINTYGKNIVGIDEVGRGCLAGPVVAASIILNHNKLTKLPESKLKLIRDSKKLSSKQRQSILSVIMDLASYHSIGMASAREIERYGIVGGTFLAMKRSLEIYKSIDHILVDGRFKIPDIASSQSAIIGGDAKSFTIAAASIIAKESRDKLMQSEAERYPHWELSSNVGYGTKAHLEAIKRHGICPQHRRNFSPIRDL